VSAEQVEVCAMLLQRWMADMCVCMLRNRVGGRGKGAATTQLPIPDLLPEGNLLTNSRRQHL
jgi:hypothetical protein